MHLFPSNALTVNFLSYPDIKRIFVTFSPTKFSLPRPLSSPPSL